MRRGRRGNPRAHFPSVRIVPTGYRTLPSPATGRHSLASAVFPPLRGGRERAHFFEGGGLQVILGGGMIFGVAMFISRPARISTSLERGSRVFTFRGLSLARRGRPHGRRDLLAAPTLHAVVARLLGGRPEETDLARIVGARGCAGPVDPPCQKQCYLHGEILRLLPPFQVRASASVESRTRRAVADSRHLEARAAGSALTAGPSMTAPVIVKREPWQGQSQVRSAVFHSTRQPR